MTGSAAGLVFERVDLEPVILPVPFRDDVFHALEDRGASVKCLIVQFAVWRYVVPD